MMRGNEFTLKVNELRDALFEHEQATTGDA
jgi:hypothetical protein